MILKVVGLFAGIGALEEGLRISGLHADVLCEIDSSARRILAKHFPTAQLLEDVRDMRTLPSCDVLAAGFPCQDLSQAGRKDGISGRQSSLVDEIFRLLRPKATRPEWIVLENVSYMVRLHRGAALEHILRRLESFGYRWAYRVVDARAFGIPQRRQRVIIVAAQTSEPGRVLFAESHRPDQRMDDLSRVDPNRWYGFYWTEGRRGIGWTTDAVPTIKGGSSLGIASPPAVWIPSLNFVGTPTIQDVERLQGLTPRWTEPDALEDAQPRGVRWRLTGNAVCVPMAKWLGEQLVNPTASITGQTEPLRSSTTWPWAALGDKYRRASVDCTVWPNRPRFTPLSKFLSQPLTPLSIRATEGFLARASDSLIRYPNGFLASVACHAARLKGELASTGSASGAVTSVRSGEAA